MAVSGPGMTNCISGLANAWSNKWPMILLAGAHDLNQDGTGGFQECDQLLAAQPFVKYYVKVSSVDRIPFYIEKAFRESMYGTPGPVYIDLPGNILREKCLEDDITNYTYVEDIPRTFADPTCISKAFDVLKTAKNPLVIVGKGVAYADAAEEIKVFIEDTQLPFLPTPMAKGTLPDNHPLFVGSARSLALKDADVIVLVCARLNWVRFYSMISVVNELLIYY